MPVGLAEGMLAFPYSRFCDITAHNVLYVTLNHSGRAYDQALPQIFSNGQSIGRATQPYYPSRYVEIDTGRLLGECILSVCIGGIAALFSLRRHFEQHNSPS